MSDIIWSSQIVSEKQFPTQMKSNAIQISDDGTELFMCLSHTEESKISKGVGTNSNFTEFLTLVAFDIESFEFIPPYPVVAMKRGEYFCSFTVGPIMKETFTRVAFVHTNTATRVLSMETGQEIKTSIFPHEPTLDSFRPILECNIFRPIFVANILCLFPFLAFILHRFLERNFKSVNAVVYLVYLEARFF